MASTVTHTFFILDVYDKLDTKTKKLLIDEKSILKSAAQGMDPFFFYKIITPWKGKRMREFGEFFHDNYTYEFFETLINYIKYNGYARNSQVMAFLYGTLSHYVLDSNIHPFVIYKSGVFDKNNKDSYKYNMMHEEMESMFDNYLISLRLGIKPWKFKVHKFCFEKVEFSSTFKEVIDFSFNQTFGIRNMTKFYSKALKSMKTFFIIFRDDCYGLKRKFYNIVDFICPKSFRRKTPLSYKINLDYSMFNLEHNKWYNPTSKKIKSNKSILDIYTESVFECVSIINKINSYIYDDIGELKDILKNDSYITGRDWTKHYELKFFE